VYSSESNLIRKCSGKVVDFTAACSCWLFFNVLRCLPDTSRRISILQTRCFCFSRRLVARLLLVEVLAFTLGIIRWSG